MTRRHKIHATLGRVSIIQHEFLAWRGPYRVETRRVEWVLIVLRFAPVTGFQASPTISLRLVFI